MFLGFKIIALPAISCSYAHIPNIVYGVVRLCRLRYKRGLPYGPHVSFVGQHLTHAVGACI